MRYGVCARTPTSSARSIAESGITTLPLWARDGSWAGAAITLPSTSTIATENKIARLMQLLVVGQKPLLLEGRLRSGFFALGGLPFPKVSGETIWLRHSTPECRR